MTSDMLRGRIPSGYIYTALLVSKHSKPFGALKHHLQPPTTVKRYLFPTLPHDDTTVASQRTSGDVSSGLRVSFLTCVNTEALFEVFHTSGHLSLAPSASGSHQAEDCRDDEDETRENDKCDDEGKPVKTSAAHFTSISGGMRAVTDVTDVEIEITNGDLNRIQNLFQCSSL